MLKSLRIGGREGKILNVLFLPVGGDVERFLLIPSERGISLC